MVFGSTLIRFAFLGSISAWLYYYNILSPKNGAVKRNLRGPYDFIVVGAGSAGSVLASRLSEDPNVRVLLLEAGGGETLFSEIPALCNDLQLTHLDWQYLTVPQVNACLGLENNQSRWPRGKVLGGSSTINYNIYVRGNHRDYDHWAALGNYGWSWKEVLPYFLKSEDNQNPLTAYDTEYHHIGVPGQPRLTVSEVPFRTPLLTAFLEAASENGYPVRDFNGRYQTGAFPLQSTTRNGVRCSAAKAFLKDNVRRPNLHILMDSHVLKILFKKDANGNDSAYGVEFRRKRRTYVANALKEVIVSAGAISTPQLLMLSGIGPREHLKTHKIPVIADVPGVGQNLQDHIYAGGMIWTLDARVSIVRRRFINLDTLLKYVIAGQGVMSSLGGAESICYVKTPYANQSDDWPDIQLQFVSSDPSSDQGKHMRYTFGFTEKSWEQYYKKIEKPDSFYMLPIILRPKSRGEILLSSTDPFQKPLINPRYYHHPDDIKVIIEGMKIAVKFANAKSFKKFGAKFVSAMYPGCENVAPQSDNYWECLARHEPLTMYHPVGTAKMGPETDPMAVVDPELRLRKVKRLRVTDASVMPFIISSNTNAATIMIAEKGSDLIKREWNLN